MSDRRPSPDFTRALGETAERHANAWDDFVDDYREVQQAVHATLANVAGMSDNDPTDDFEASMNEEAEGAADESATVDDIIEDADDAPLPFFKENNELNTEALRLKRLYPGLSPSLYMKKSTEDRMGNVWRQWFAFCSTRNRSPVEIGIGLGLYGDPNGYDHHILGDFFTHLVGAGANKCLIACAIVWGNANLKAEFVWRATSRGCFNYQMPSPFVGRIPAVKDATAAVKLNAVELAELNGDDIQADEHNTITEEQMRRLVDTCMRTGNVGDPLYNMSNIKKLNFLASFFTQCQICRRGEDLYDSTLAQRYVKTIKTIGPLPGTACSNLISRRSKNNLGSKKQTATFAPHADPLRDGAFYHGMLWLFRYCVENECGNGKFPNFLDHDALSNTPIYRKVNKLTKLGKDGFLELWTGVFDACPFIDVIKKTHQCKGQGIREMKDAGIDTNDIAHYVNQRTKSACETDALMTFYLIVAPVICIVQRAGSQNPRRPELHCPAYSRVPVPEELLRLDPMLADLLDQRDRIHALFDSCPSRAERVKRRLYTAKGSIDAMVHDIKRVFQVFAARPVDPLSLKVCKESDSIQQIKGYRHGTFSSVMGLPVFQTEAFLQFRDTVRAAENLDSLELENEAPILNALEQAIATQMSGRLDSVIREIHTLTLRFNLMERQGSNPDLTAKISALLNGQADGMSKDELVSAIMSVVQQSRTDVRTSEPTCPAPSTIRPVIPVAAAPDAALDTLQHSNQPRKRRRCIREQHILMAEAVSEVPRPEFHSFPMRNEADLFKLVTEHHSVWIGYEQEHGCKWRTDKLYETTEGTEGLATANDEPPKKMHKSNARSTWYGARKSIFDVFDWLLLECNDVTTAKHCILALYNGVSLNASGNRTVKVVLPRFDRIWERTTGQKKPKGRPSTDAPSVDPTKFDEFDNEFLRSILRGDATLGDVSICGVVEGTYDTTESTNDADVPAAVAAGAVERELDSPNVFGSGTDSPLLGRARGVETPIGFVGGGDGFIGGGDGDMDSLLPDFTELPVPVQPIPGSRPSVVDRIVHASGNGNESQNTGSDLQNNHRVSSIQGERIRGSGGQSDLLNAGSVRGDVDSTYQGESRSGGLSNRDGWSNGDRDSTSAHGGGSQGTIHSGGLSHAGGSQGSGGGSGGFSNRVGYQGAGDSGGFSNRAGYQGAGGSGGLSNASGSQGTGGVGGLSNGVGDSGGLSNGAGSQVAGGGSGGLSNTGGFQGAGGGSGGLSNGAGLQGHAGVGGLSNAAGSQGVGDSGGLSNNGAGSRGAGGGSGGLLNGAGSQGAGGGSGGLSNAGGSQGAGGVGGLSNMAEGGEGRSSSSGRSGQGFYRRSGTGNSLGLFSTTVTGFGESEVWVDTHGTPNDVALLLRQQQYIDASPRSPSGQYNRDYFKGCSRRVLSPRHMHRRAFSDGFDSTSVSISAEDTAMMQRAAEQRARAEVARRMAEERRKEVLAGNQFERRLEHHSRERVIDRINHHNKTQCHNYGMYFDDQEWCRKNGIEYFEDQE